VSRRHDIYAAMEVSWGKYGRYHHFTHLCYTPIVTNAT
jgi:hypothetical protein